MIIAQLFVLHPQHFDEAYASSISVQHRAEMRFQQAENLVARDR